MPQKEIQTVVTPLCQKLADKMNYELVDAELVKEGPGRYLRIYIDRPGGISLDELEKFHREIQPQLDRVDYDFLEVCSPGLDRPLKKDRDFEHALGGKVEVRLFKPVDGKKLFEGALRAWNAETVTIEDASGLREFPRRGVALIKPVIEIDLDDDEGDDIL
ncbi:MAG: ribosome maturation factor RimP [Clostridiales bacterium]|nr:ribosome maturation factor RimP [Clostridiales bacterium]MDY2835535.1 ribosome maturation factor RimP [Candidatus Aphodomonas sp.]